MQEDFVEFPPDPFHGLNWTTYNHDTKKWEQTMVDNRGHSFFMLYIYKKNSPIAEVFMQVHVS